MEKPIEKMSREELIYRTISEGNRINRAQFAAVDARLSETAKDFNNQTIDVSLALAEIAEQQAQDTLETQLAITELAEVILNG